MSGDLISRKAALDALDQSINILEAEERIEDLSAAEPKIIRCKDCRNSEEDEDEYGDIFRWCYAERREE